MIAPANDAPTMTPTGALVVGRLPEFDNVCENGAPLGPNLDKSRSMRHGYLRMPGCLLLCASYHTTTEGEGASHTSSCGYERDRVVDPQRKTIHKVKKSIWVPHVGRCSGPASGLEGHHPGRLCKQRLHKGHKVPEYISKTK